MVQNKKLFAINAENSKTTAANIFYWKRTDAKNHFSLAVGDFLPQLFLNLIRTKQTLRMLSKISPLYLFITTFLAQKMKFSIENLEEHDRQATWPVWTFDGYDSSSLERKDPVQFL